LRPYFYVVDVDVAVMKHEMVMRFGTERNYGGSLPSERAG
jgi:hypothetical protein